MNLNTVMQPPTLLMLAKLNCKQSIPEFLSFSPVFGRRTESIPLPVLTNITFVLFYVLVGQIAASIDSPCKGVVPCLCFSIFIQEYAER
jgi:hypothetical protein